MRSTEWNLILSATMLILFAAMFDPLVSFYLALLLLVAFAIMRLLQNHNRQYR